MNVLITTDAFPPGAGGSGRSTAVLAKALSEEGHRVRVVVSRVETTRQKEWQGVEVAEVQVPPAKIGNAPERERAFAAGMTLAAGEEAWDLVHAQHWLSAGASHRALPRLPRVVTVRDYWPVCVWSTMLSGNDSCPGCSYSRRVSCVGKHRPWLWPVAPLLPPLVGRELERRRRVLEESDAIVAVSRHVASTLPLESTVVIPNMLDAPPKEIPRPSGVPERYVLFVGKLEPGKAPDRLAGILESARSDLPLIVAGTGRLEGALRARIPNARFLGWVDEARLPALVKHADCLLFPSRWQEPLSRVLLDALSLGAVIVAEPTGGTADIVVDGESGLLRRGEAELGRALARVVEDKVLAERLRKGALLRADKVFSREVVLPQVEALYRGILES
ncbi:MAG: glycosyltransferase family 4 protein [Vicinamibacteria bacterium]